MLADLKIYFVRHVEIFFLSQILNPVDQLSGDTFLAQFFRDVDIQSHRQASLVSNQPARDIFRHDFHVVQCQFQALRAYLQRVSTLFFKIIDIILVHFCHESGNLLHVLAVFRA